MMMRRLLTGLAMVFVISMGCGTVQAEDTVCITCHGGLPGKYGEPVKLWKGSIHSENGITCNACHGGDPKDAANAMKKERGFLGAPKYNDVPQFCGRCHVGVLKDYQASAHGRALSTGRPQLRDLPRQPPGPQSLTGTDQRKVLQPLPQL